MRRSNKIIWLTCKICGKRRILGKTKGWLFSHSPQNGTICIKCKDKER